MSPSRHVLTLSCPDRIGIVSAISGRLFMHGANIIESQQFGDSETGRFFMRTVFAHTRAVDDERFKHDLGIVTGHYGMDWQLRDLAQRRRVMLLVSRYDHCLSDLLYRWRIDELPMDITAVVANHPRETYRHLDLDGVPFHYLPVSADDKARQEAELWSLIERTDTELVVLARYMQVLSPQLVAKLAGRCINIHHSFLPGFKGARPYHQTHARGVKLIGATAHFVTEDLDEGPIIEQDTQRVSHQHTPADLVRIGRDVERRVLAQALRYWLDDRILPNGDKTVVFSL